jgi:hypothetical protein
VKLPALVLTAKSPDANRFTCVTLTPSTVGAATLSMKPSRYSMMASRVMKPCGSSPA